MWVAHTRTTPAGYEIHFATATSPQVATWEEILLALDQSLFRAVWTAALRLCPWPACSVVLPPWRNSGRVPLVFTCTPPARDPYDNPLPSMPTDWLNAATELQLDNLWQTLAHELDTLADWHSVIHFHLELEPLHVHLTPLATGTESECFL
jgi:hypothetical protein